MKITPKHLAMIESLCGDYLARKGYTLADVKLGSDAFKVLHSSGAWRAVEDDGGDYIDNHYATALRAIMPNATIMGKAPK